MIEQLKEMNVKFNIKASKEIKKKLKEPQTYIDNFSKENNKSKASFRRWLINHSVSYLLCCFLVRFSWKQVCKVTVILRKFCIFVTVVDLSNKMKPFIRVMAVDSYCVVLQFQTKAIANNKVLLIDKK